MSYSEQRKLYDLITLSVEGTVTPEQFLTLKQMLRGSPEAVKLYVDYMAILSDIRSSNSLIDKESLKLSGMNDPACDSNFWQALADEEKNAPEVEIDKEESRPELIQNVVYTARQEPRISKFNILFFALNAAAVLFLVLFLKFVPLEHGVEVATLTDSMHAKWINGIGSMAKGTRLTTRSDELLLQEGLAELRLDNNTKVVIEGPAGFELLAEDRIDLHYGRIFATVPSEAIGFTINTPTSRIIDLGTEFGVQADVSGDVQLHVIKGKTTLIAGGKSNKVNLEITEGQAKKVSGVDGTVLDIEYNRTKFARKINSAATRIWRGENLDLASIAAGHDGFQDVGSLIGLNPVTGKYTTSVVQKNRNTNGRYNPVADSDFIDGVFVPDGGSGPIQVTSLGHTFACPDTSGIYTHEIAAYRGSVGNQRTTIPPVIFEGQEVANDAVLMLHSNAGITFDLQMIRNSLPQFDLRSFKAAGVPMKEFNPDIYFWVLIDGQIRYEKKIITDERSPISLDIELRPQDRFLTLIVTDGLRATEDERKDPCSSDFFYLIKPELSLTDNPDK